jgi:tRNA(fMet)-specific endonuclease VapC
VSYLLDTNICIAFLTEGENELCARIAALSPDDVALCSVVKAELVYGARASGRVAANLRRLDGFFAPFVSHPFDDAAATAYGVVRAQLRREGQPIGGNDLMIAAIALARDVTLVTRNDREFRRVGGLRIEVW